ncbi:MAG: FKBP-type peptidyl-prolyl cis-trans isomerase [Minisyncoccia bacterium]
MSEKATILVVLLFSCLLFSLAWYVNTSRAPQQQVNDASPAPRVETSKLNTIDTQVGTGAEASAGKRITVHYTGKLADGTVFDSSVQRGIPEVFDLGKGTVIQGWELGIPGMKVGGKRKLTIPPELGYGADTVASIPPNSTLIFDVELLKVE